MWLDIAVALKRQLICHDSHQQVHLWPLNNTLCLCLTYVQISRTIKFTLVRCIYKLCIFKNINFVIWFLLFSVHDLQSFGLDNVSCFNSFQYFPLFSIDLPLPTILDLTEFVWYNRRSTWHISSNIFHLAKTIQELSTL